MTHVLIVEDEEASRYLLKALLEGSGYRVSQASNGLEALAAARRDAPEVVVSDVLMPKMDGFALCRAWMQDAALKTIPFVFYSATYTDPQDEQLALSLGAARYLIKPVEPQVVLAELQAVLSHWPARPAPATLLEDKDFYALHDVAMARKLERKLGQIEAMNRQLRENEQNYRQLFETNPQPMWVYDLQTLRFLAVNNAALAHYGYRRDEFLAMTIADIRPPEDVPKLRANIARTKTLDFEHAGQWRHRKHDGTLIDVEITSHLLDFQGRRAKMVMALDITERKIAEAKIQRLTLLYAALSHCNQAIVRCHSEPELFSAVCRAAVQFGGMKMAWIGLVDPVSQRVTPVAQSGDGAHHLADITLSVDPALAAGRGGVGTAIREQRPVWCQDYLNDPMTAPWHDMAGRAGWRGLATLPLYRGGAVIGAFVLFSDVVNAFDQAARDLLLEMASDIGYALDNFALEAGHRKAEQALRASEARFRDLTEMSSDFYWESDAGHRLTTRTEGFRGTSMSAFAFGPLIGKRRWEMPHLAPDQSGWLSHQATLEAHQPFRNFEFSRAGTDGSTRHFSISGAPRFDAAGAFQGYRGVGSDITERKRTEDALRLSALFFDNTREGVIISDLNARILSVNPAFSAITGYTEAEVLGQNPRLLQSGRQDRSFFQSLWASLLEVGHWQGELWNRRNNGEIYPEWLSISTARDNDGKPSRYVAVFSDISQIKQSAEKLEHLAHYDALTQLPNRLLLFSRLQHCIEQAQRNQTMLALLMLDLDHFKDVNDSFGHLAGDELLQQVAQRLNARLREADTICRLGGDEFTVLLEKITQPEDAARVANDIIAALSEPWHLANGAEVRIGVSVGISLYPAHGQSAETLLQQADTSLYQAKAEGRGRFKYFSEDLTHTVRARIDMEVRLRRALEHNELRVYYQPQVDIASGRVVGAEALVRWQDPVEGLIAPGRFIRVAEETGLITPIGNWVLQQTCRQGQRWLAAGLPPLRLAVNLSAHQFLHSNIGQVVAEALAQSGFPAARLELELTESALMERESEAIEILGQLRALGVQLAIDDFGTGYSSLAYLKRFPLDILKIDKRFVDDLAHDPDDQAIATTIIAMAHALRLKALAEGVETQAQLDFLQAQGCDMYQGYLFSPPLPTEKFEQLLRASTLA